MTSTGNSSVSGSLHVMGNIDVEGNINSVTKTETTLEVVDKLVIVASGSTSANSDGGGVQFGGYKGSDSVASVLYDHANAAIDFNIGGTTQARLADGAFRPETDNDVDLGASGAEFKDLYIDGVAYVDSLQADQLGAALDANSQAITNINVDSGDISGTDVTVGAGKTLDVSAGTLTLANNQISGDKVEGGTIASITISQLGGAMDANSQAMTNVNIDSGNIDGATIATSDVTVGAGKTLDVSAGTLTTSAAQKLAIMQGAGANVDIGAFDLRASTLTADSATQGRVAIYGANGVLSEDSDLSFSGDTLTVTKLGAYEQAGAVDFSDEAMTNVNIDSGAIDGTTIGASSQSSVKATTLSGSGAMNVDGNAQFNGTVTGKSSITAGTSFIIGSADLNEADMEKLDGITNGTAAASKALVLDASLNIANIGTVGCGAITSGGISSFYAVSASAGLSGSIVRGGSLALASGATVTGIADEDGMGSNSATLLATQQSIKAYVDAQVTAQDLDFQADSGGALNIDLDSETLSVLGTSNEIVTAGSGNTITISLPDDVTIGQDLVVSRNLSVNGNATLGDASGDDITFNGSLASNLAVKVNDAYTIGSSSKKLAAVYANNVYTGDFHMKNERGDWTLFEESDHIRIRNNSTGQEFKLDMTPLA